MPAMTDLEPLLTLWHELHATAAEYVLATVVAVEGSGYRKPGAMMLISSDGRRAGTISGGCLEGEVAKKAFWHTTNGPVVRTYSTAADDGDVPFGMGCGGVVHLLLERSNSASLMLEKLQEQYLRREPLAIATVLDGDATGSRVCWTRDQLSSDDFELESLARVSFVEQSSSSTRLVAKDGKSSRVRLEFFAARPGLFVFGAGDDAFPLVRQARELGWYVVLADGRSHLATQVRFPNAHEVHVTPANAPFPLQVKPMDAAAVMTHSLEQDTYFVSELLNQRLCYLGVLGPRRRTAGILEAIVQGTPASEGAESLDPALSLAHVHAPMGLDLGGDTPSEIALSVIAEIQKRLRGGSGKALRELSRRVAEMPPIPGSPVAAPQSRTC